MITEMDRRLSVALLEQQPIMAAGVRALLEASGRYCLLQPVESLEALSRTVALHSPRVVLVDKSCGVMTLISWLEQVKQNTAVVVWGTGLAEADALRLVHAGARGVLAKGADAETLLACLDAVCSGTTWMEEALFQRAFRGTAGGRSDLTHRERQVLELVEQGLRNKQIARELGIQPGTVKIHMKHIFEKTGIRGRFGLALSGWRERGEAVRATA